MPRFRVFLGAPSAARIHEAPGPSSIWHTVSATHSETVFPPATIEAASRRISSIYQNIIFNEDDDEPGNEDGDMDMDADEDVHKDQTTFLTWPPTAPERGAPRPSQPEITFLKQSAAAERTRASLDTQDLSTDASTSYAYSYSDASSIGRLPAFSFSLHALSSLASLSTLASSARSKGSRKVSILVAALEVDGPDAVRIKKGPDAGREVGLLKLILGADDGAVAKLTAWREVAEVWGGANAPEVPGVRKGDVVLLENVLATWDPAASETGPGVGTPFLAFSASPHLKSRLTICYRTLPTEPTDARFRPDLRLGASDAAVRRVGAVVAWFEGMAGLA